MCAVNDRTSSARAAHRAACAGTAHPLRARPLRSPALPPGAPGALPAQRRPGAREGRGAGPARFAPAAPGSPPAAAPPVRAAEAEPPAARAMRHQPHRSWARAPPGNVVRARRLQLPTRPGRTAASRPGLQLPACTPAAGARALPSRGAPRPVPRVPRGPAELPALPEVFSEPRDGGRRPLLPAGQAPAAGPQVRGIQAVAGAAGLLPAGAGRG